MLTARHQPFDVSVHAPPSDTQATSIEGPVDALATTALRITDRTAVVAVVGMGYVGLPLLLAAGAEGFSLIGLDTDEERIRLLRNRHTYLIDVSDEQLASLERVQLSTDPLVLIAADVIVLAVPTPLRDGAPDLSLVRAAVTSVATTLRPGQLVVLESTTYPGTTEDVVRPILETSGLVAGRDFALAYSPERIDPGTAHTLRATPKIVAGLGELDAELARVFYATLVDEVVLTSSIRAAEMAKLIENTFRQVNIALVNELATIAPAIGVDIWEALEAAGTKPFGYMPFWPGPGVGGHCIAIDPSYLSWRVEQRLGFGIGFIEHARSVNNRMPAYVTSRISETLNLTGRALHGARLGVLGLTYKPGVNDLRESPALDVIGQLVAAGADCKYHDPFVPSVLVGGRRHDDVPRVGLDESPLLLESVDLDADFFSTVDCVVILTAHPGIDYAAAIAGAPLVFDAVGVTRNVRHPHVVLL